MEANEETLPPQTSLEETVDSSDTPGSGKVAWLPTRVCFCHKKIRDFTQKIGSD